MLQQDILILISDSLDHKSHARLLATSKTNASLLLPSFTAKARSHLLRHMALRIINGCMRAPSDVYTTRAIEDDGFSIRFTAPNKHGFGPMALFSVDPVDPIRVVVRVGYNIVYSNSQSSFSFITDHTDICVSPSVVSAGDLSPERIIEWCENIPKVSLTHGRPSSVGRAHGF